MGPRRQRRLRRDLGLFLDTTTVLLRTGYDFAYAMPLVMGELSGYLGEDFRAQMAGREGEGFSGFLARLARDYPVEGHRLWFGVLSQLYGTGAALIPFLTAFSKMLREERDRDWDRHQRAVPLRISLILAVFFVAPALFLIFVPLLGEIGESLR